MKGLLNSFAVLAVMFLMASCTPATPQTPEAATITTNSAKPMKGVVEDVLTKSSFPV